jgi:hypothetical protein
MSCQKPLPPIFHVQFAPEYWSKLMTLRAMFGDREWDQPNNSFKYAHANK